MLSAKYEQFGVATQTSAQSRWLTADLTVARRHPALEPQVGLAVELILEMVSQRVFRRVVARARESAVAGTSHTLPLDHDGVPFTGVRTDFALARRKQTPASVAAAAAAIAPAAGARFVLRLIDFQGTAVEVRAVQRLHGTRSIGIGHLDEPETARPAGVAIGDE